MILWWTKVGAIPIAILRAMLGAIARAKTRAIVGAKSSEIGGAITLAKLR